MRALAAEARVARSEEVPTEGWEMDVGGVRALRDAMDDMTALLYGIVRGMNRCERREVRGEGSYVAIGRFGGARVDLFFLTEGMFRCDGRLQGDNGVI